MGIAKQHEVRVVISKKGNQFLTHPFINKNGDLDKMYVPVPKGWCLKPLSKHLNGSNVFHKHLNKQATLN